MYHKKSDKRSIESSNMIYESLRELVYKKEYRSITIKEIVDHANIGRSTFYRNYDTIDDVLIKKSDEEFDKCVDYLLQQLQLNHTQIPNSISNFMYHFFQYWNTNYEVLELLLKVNQFDRIEDSIHKIISRLVEFSNQTGYTITNTKYFIAIRVGMMKSVLSEWIKDNRAFPPDQLSKYVVEQMQHGGDILLHFSHSQ